jgi:protein-S-isoprenylcysteine O-methyltransferase Ste14
MPNRALASSWLLAKNLLFTALLPGTAAVLLPWWIAVARDEVAWSATRMALAAPLFLAGVAIYACTVFNFAHIGRGTPAPIDAPRTLIVQGPHRFVRNPMYIGVLAVVLGWALVFRSGAIVLYAAGLALAFHLFVLAVEEPSLRRQFPDDYARYARAVRRWLPGPPYRAGR